MSSNPPLPNAALLLASNACASFKRATVISGVIDPQRNRPASAG